MDSTSSQEFFDAEDGEPNRSQILNIRHDSQDSGERDTVDDIVSEGDDSETSSDAGEAIGSFDRMPREGQSSIFPPKPESLTPLPLERVRRRTTVLPAKVPPPSIIGFLRKNAGKDLSTVSMPVSSNEPTSLLQRTAEQMEYS
ncbi:Oxysterol-binding protein 3, partial [Cryomyces antarcticus]